MNDDIDFLKELNDITVKGYNTDVHGNISYDNVCLISSEPLEKNYIELDCKHKFNYDSIFHYLWHKDKKTKHFQASVCGIECPYCLNKTYKTLPIRKIDSMFLFCNSIHIPMYKCLTDEHKCQYKEKAYHKCHRPWISKYCVRHNKYLRNVLKDDVDDIAYVNKLEQRISNRLQYIGVKYDFNDDINDDLLLECLDNNHLRKICSYYSLNNINHYKKYELISMIKSLCLND